MVKMILELIRKSKHQQFKLKVTLTYISLHFEELWKTMFEQLLKIIGKSQQSHLCLNLNLLNIYWQPKGKRWGDILGML